MDEQAKDPHQWPTPEKDLTARRRAFGVKLRMAREEKGLTAQALSQLTRINQQYIEALEEGGLERLPGAVFGRGFVRCITKNMRIDGDAYVAEFDACWSIATPSSVLKVEIKSKPPKRHAEAVAKSIATMQSLVRRGIILKVSVPIVALALAIVAIRHGSANLPKIEWGKYLHLNTASISTPEAPKVEAKELDLQPVSAEPEVAKAEEPAAASTAVAPVAAAAAPTQATGTEAPAVAETPAVTPSTGSQILELTVTEPVRVRLDVDQGQTVTKELTPDTYRFSFNDKADLLIYDAAALKISFNGKQLGSLGTKGRVRRLSFQAETPETPKNR